MGSRGGVECSPPKLRELETRLRELADVHRQLAAFLEDVAKGPQVDDPPPEGPAVHAT